MNDIQIISETIEKAIKNLEKTFNFLSTRQEIMSIESIVNYYNRMGLGKIILNSNDSKTSKILFFKSGKSKLLFLKLYKGVYPKYSFNFVPSFVATTYYGIIPILLSGNNQLSIEFANELVRLPKETYKDKADIAICYALKYLLLNEMEKAEEMLANHYVTAKNLCKYLGLVIAGIIKNEVILIQKGINNQLRWHKKFNKGSMFFSISQEATAWVKLAQNFGFNLDISSEFINKNLLMTDIGIEYEGIDELYDILEINH